MIVKDKTDLNIERHKQRLGLTGDVYIIDGVQIESLESHKNYIKNSIARNIEEAEIERLIYEEEQKQKMSESEEFIDE